jgi:chaperonin GroES
MNIKPVADNILIEPEKGKEKTESGIFLPDNADKGRPEKGKVVAVGPGKKNREGKQLPLAIKKGDVVIFTKYGPSEIKVDEKDYLIAKEDDILAIIE